MCRVTMSHLRVTVGHPRVTISHLNPFAALGRLADQNIDKHLSIYSKSGINLIMMVRQP